MGDDNYFSYSGGQKSKCRFIAAINLGVRREFILAEPGNCSRTCFERLDGDRRGVVPQSLPDLSELSVSEAALELEAAPLDLPLVARVVREVGRRRFVNLGIF